MQNRQRLEKLLERSEELEKRMQRDSERKAELKKQIEAVTAQQFISFLKDNDLNDFDKAMELLALAKQALDSGLTQREIQRRLGLNPITIMEDNTNETKDD